MDRIPEVEVLAEQRRLAALISFKKKHEYSEICSFVVARMPLAKVRSNILILCGTWNKAALIRQQSELADGAVMELIMPCHG